MWTAAGAASSARAPAAMLRSLPLPGAAAARLGTALRVLSGLCGGGGRTWPAPKQACRAAGLLHPADTVMDMNIGAALWLAAQAEGHVRLVSAGGRPLPAVSDGARCCKRALARRCWLSRLRLAGTHSCSAVGVSRACCIASRCVAVQRLFTVRPMRPNCARQGDSRPEIPYWAGGTYRSAARVMLVGHGADEQCAGYGRHRTRFRTHVRPTCARRHGGHG